MLVEYGTIELIQSMGMSFGRTERIPEWAARERTEDLAWIGENTHILLPAAKLAFEESGRGAVIVDTNTVVECGEQTGNPMFYLPAEEIQRYGWLPAIQMVSAYDPSWEFVTVLLKRNRESAYRIGVPTVKNKSRS